MLHHQPSEEPQVKRFCGHVSHHGTCPTCQQRAKARQLQHIADSTKARAQWQIRMARMPTL